MLDAPPFGPARRDVTRPRAGLGPLSVLRRATAFATLAGLVACADLGGSGSTDAGTTANTGNGAGNDSGTNVAVAAGAAIELANDGGYLAAARGVMQRAKVRLDVVQFETTQGKTEALLTNDIIDAHKRGVAVHVLLDDEVDKNGILLATLKAAGVDAKLDSSSVRTHAKIVSNESEAMIGSTNWSYTSITYNHEANVVVRVPSVVAALHDYLDKLWAKSSKTLPTTPVGTSDATLYTDAGFAALATPMIDAAKSKIWIITYGMNLDPQYKDGDVWKLVDRVIAAHKRGVDVRVILETADYATDTNAVNKQARDALVAAGIDARLDPPSTITHAKVLVADDVAIVGTNNWGYGGFALYHEVGIRTENAAVLAGLEAYAASIWAASK